MITGLFSAFNTGLTDFDALPLSFEARGVIHGGGLTGDVIINRMLYFGFEVLAGAYVSELWKGE